MEVFPTQMWGKLGGNLEETGRKPGGNWEETWEETWGKLKIYIEIIISSSY